MAHYFTILVLWAALIKLTLQVPLSENELKQMKGTFCGPLLSETLSLICDGVYNNKHKRNMYKNKVKQNGFEDFGPFDYSEEPMLPFPFRNKQRAKALLALGFRKRTSGVASECCQKSCSLWEMSSYCGE